MRNMGIREFRDSATKLTSGSETIVIKKHGEPVGFYIPLRPKSIEERRRILARVDRLMKRLVKKTGFTEDEIADMMKWK